MATKDITYDGTEIETNCRRFLRENVTKPDIYWGSYRIHIFVFLTLLQIFVPRLEIIFFINNDFLVCILKCSTSGRVNSVIET